MPPHGRHPFLVQSGKSKAVDTAPEDNKRALYLLLLSGLFIRG